MAGSPVPLIAVLAPFVASLIALVIGGKRPNAAGWISVSSIFISLLCLLTAARDALAGTIHYFRVPWFPQLGVDLGIRLDGLSLVTGSIVALVSFLIAVYSIGYMHGDPGLRRYWFFFSFFVGSMLLLVTADNLLLMLIGWEGTGLCSYALIGHWYTDEEERWVGDPGRIVWDTPMYFEPSHSGIRALIFTRLGDVGLLAGIAALLFTAGTLNFEALAEHHAWADALATRGLFLAALVALSLGALAKSAQFPFHEWLVTAMTGPTSVSALIHAATMVNAGVYFLLRMSPIIWEVASPSLPLSSQATTFFLFIASIGAFTAFLMATQAVVSRELKLILAFSTASQLGYMFLGIGAGALAGHVIEGFIAGLGHMFSQAFFKASLFMAAGALIHILHTRFIDGMGALGGKLKLTAASMTLAAASLMGLAPFMGFWTKDACIHTAGAAGFTFGHVLGLITAILTATYAGRLLIRVFLVEPYEAREHSHEHVHEPSPVMLLPYAVLAVGCLLVGLLWPYTFESFVKLSTTAVPGLAHGHVDGHVEAVELEIEPGMLLFSVTAGLGIPLFLAYTYKTKPSLVTELRTGPLRSLHSFLYDRWYLNALYYRVIAYPMRSLSLLLFRLWDTLVVDRFYHKLLPTFFSRLSIVSFGSFEVPVIDRVPNVRLVNAVKSLGGVAQKLQTGILNHYVVLFLGGMIALGVIILVVI